MTLNAPSGSIASTESGTQRSPKSSEKSEPTQFAQLWAVSKYDLQITSNIFPECSQKQKLNQNYLRIREEYIRCHLYTGTPKVPYQIHPITTQMRRWTPIRTSFPPQMVPASQTGQRSKWHTKSYHIRQQEAQQSSTHAQKKHSWSLRHQCHLYNY